MISTTLQCLQPLCVAHLPGSLTVAAFDLSSHVVDESILCTRGLSAPSSPDKCYSSNATTLSDPGTRMYVAVHPFIDSLSAHGVSQVVSAVWC